MSIFGKINERMNESVSVRSYATVSFKNKSLSRILSEGFEDIDGISAGLSNAEIKNTMNTIDKATEDPDAINQITNAENGEVDENGNPVTRIGESAMAIRESVSGFFANVWEKIKKFFERVKKWIVELFGKIVFMLKSIFASNKHLVDKYGNSVTRDYDGVDVQAIKIKIDELMKVKPEKVDTIMENVKSKLSGVLNVIDKYAKILKYAANGQNEGGYFIKKDKREENYDKQKEHVDSDEFKEEIKSALDNNDEFPGIKVYEAFTGNNFSATTISDLSAEFKENIRETNSPVTITPKDVGGYSSIKKRMSEGADIIKKVENVRSKLEDSIKKIQKDMENLYTNKLKGVKKTEVKSSISSAFTISIDFLGVAIKAVNTFIKDWVELYKHQLGVDRSLFIKLYKKATGKKPQNNSVDAEELETDFIPGVEGVDEDPLTDNPDGTEAIDTKNNVVEEM